jgi:sn1-specific diacylglycerol lipase
MLHSNWDTYSRQGIDLAADLASFGFGIVKSSTKLGFSITHAVASLTLGLTTSAVDHALFGGGPVTTPILSGALSSIISIAEQITLAPIRLGEYITSTSLLAAHSSINLLSCIFPGSSEASFSLASFITLVKREWNELAPGENLPEKKYGLTHVVRALVAWVVLQGVTQEWDEARWLKGNWVREIHVEDPRRYTESLRERRGSRVRVTSDVIWPGGRGRIVSADFGDASTVATIRQSVNSTAAGRSLRTTTRAGQAEMKVTLRRLSKMVLAGYGGASLLFFGVPINARPSATSSASKRTEEAQMAHAINASEAEAAGDGELEEDTVGDPGAYSWWDVLLGKHDHEIFERFANGSHERGEQSTANAAKDKMKATAVIGIEHQMPRFWVLTDHGRGQIVLVLRGTSVSVLCPDVKDTQSLQAPCH